MTDQPQSIELRQHLLGMHPYVLVQFVRGAGGPEDITIRIEHGGEISDNEVGPALWVAACHLPEGQNPVTESLDQLAATEPDLAPAIERIREAWGFTS